jgi:NAD+ diphosphatase
MQQYHDLRLDYQAFEEQTHYEKVYWIFFHKGLVYIQRNDAGPVLLLSEFPESFSTFIHFIEKVGTVGGIPCLAVCLQEQYQPASNQEFAHLRGLLGLVDEPLLLYVANAGHLVHWSSRHQFCGKCGGSTANRPEERAKICNNCHTVYYPVLSSAIIVAVTRGDQLLLAHTQRFRRKFYSVLAGFVEIGETFEQAVAREVMEEVGIEVKNIQYFGSQPWPFPDSLMIGFTAEYAGGEIAIDGVELDDANWFTVDNMPPVPPTFSIAGKLIRWFIDQHKK